MTRILLILALLLYPLAVWAHDTVATARSKGAVGMVIAGSQIIFFSDELRGEFKYAAEIRYPPGFGKLHKVYFDNTDAATKSAQATTTTNTLSVTINVWRDLLKEASDWPQQPAVSPSSSTSPDDDGSTSPTSNKDLARNAYNSGLKFFNEHFDKRAYKEFSEATTLEPDNALYLFMLGQVEEARFMRFEAVGSYRKVIKLNTDKTLTAQARERLRKLGYSE